jgi:hypothetical protein
LSLNWLTGYTYTIGTPVSTNTFMVEFSLRTLGANALSPVASSF